MSPFKWLWQYIKKYKLLLFTGLFMALICSALNMLNPLLSGFIVDKVIGEGKPEILLKYITIIVGATIVKSIIRFSYIMIFENVSQNTFRTIREEIYCKLQKLDFDYFDRTRTGDIMAKMTGDMDAVRHFISWVIYQVFENATIFLFSLIMLFVINYKLALGFLVVAPFTGYFAFKLALDVKPTFSEIREQFSKLNSVVQENISGNRVVKAFAKEPYELKKFSLENEAYKQKNLESAKVWEKYLPVLDSLAGSLTVVMILGGGIMVINDLMTIGELVTFNSFIWAFNNPMRMAGWLINDIQRFVASGEKVMQILNTEPQMSISDSNHKKDKLEGNIEFKNVSFRYGHEEVLKDVSFEVKQGQTIAIIGPTGSGKSTLVNLICRFYDCNAGEILMDGINIRDIDPKSLRDSISVAMQDVFLFSDTIEGNIAYGIPSATAKEVEEVAYIAGAHEFINDFSEGYNTIVGERGVGLSGGQKQRIALARSLLKNPSILILDDTTSSVDMETEHEINKNLKTLLNERTTFVIAHRISSVKNADLILVLNDGKIIEKGTHQELLDMKGYYYNVYLNQLGKE